MSYFNQEAKDASKPKAFRMSKLKIDSVYNIKLRIQNNNNKKLFLLKLPQIINQQILIIILKKTINPKKLL